MLSFLFTRLFAAWVWAVMIFAFSNQKSREEEVSMLDRTGAAFCAALQNLNELSERLAIGRDDDDYLRRLANAAQETAIAAREAYAETRGK